jgi:hypothetical protein
MLYLISVKSAFPLSFDNIMPYFAIFITATVLLIVMVFVFIWFICHSSKINKNKDGITVKEGNGQPLTYIVTIHEKLD